jgi:hypothetical protein
MAREQYIRATSPVLCHGARAITHVDGQQAMLTGGTNLPSDTGFGTNMNLLMAVQQCELVAEAVVAAEPEKVAVPD